MSYSSYPGHIFITGADNDDTISESESSRWEDEGLTMKGEKAPLSPVSEALDEDDEDDDGGLMFDIAAAGVPAVPDGGYGWVIVFASFMCNLIVDGIANSFGVFLPKYVEEFGVGKGSVAWAGSLLCGVYMCVGPIVSALTNKFGCRPVCIAGAFVASTGFALSALSNSLGVLLITYGIIGGIGFGLIYLPAVVCVGYYFESKRAFATGIAVCGSGVGTFLFAPVADLLLQQMTWDKANLIFAGIILLCAAFGMLMRPLEVLVQLDDEDDDVEDQVSKSKPLLQRMAEDKRNYMDRGSLSGSAYFMVQLPDGTMERRQKIPLNVDPGVHSSFHLDQLTLTPVPTLPTITEANVIEAKGDNSSGGDEGTSSTTDDSSSPLIPLNSNPNLPPSNAPPNIPEPIPEESSPDGESPSSPPRESTAIAIPKRGPRRNSEGVMSQHSAGSPGSQGGTPSSSFKEHMALSKTPSKPIPLRKSSTGTGVNSMMPRNGSAPQFNYGRSIPKNGSVPVFAQMQRRASIKAVPLGSTNSANNKSKPNLQERRKSSIKNSVLSFVASKPKISGGEEDYTSMWSKQELSDGLIFSSSIKSSSQEPRHIVRPMSRKDIFYSGSIVNLPEYQSQRSIHSYRQSVLNLPQIDEVDLPEYSPDKKGYQKSQKKSCCPSPCLGGVGAFKSALKQMMDVSLLKNPIFIFIAMSNVFGCLAFYVPFVYIIDSAVSVGVDKSQAALLLSIIGVTNTIGRVVAGILSDLPWINSLLLNNICILVSGFCVGAVPFCTDYWGYILVSVFFGLFVAGYISLTSIILVDLLGLDNLTNAFGLLILFRGAAAIAGAPLAGALFDAFQNYEIPFWVAGGFLIFSAVISFCVPVVAKFAPPKKILQPPVYQVGFLEDIPEAQESSSHNSGELNEKEKFDQVESSL